jgi:predicted DNA-binding transcriptional regulator AlpA
MKLYDMASAANESGLPYLTFWRRIRDGIFPAPSVPVGGRRFFTASQIREIKRKAKAKVK